MSVRAKALAALAAAAAALAWALWIRDLRTEHAAIVAMAIGALVYSALRSWERLRTVSGRRGRRRNWPPEP